MVPVIPKLTEFAGEESRHATLLRRRRTVWWAAAVYLPLPCRPLGCRCLSAAAAPFRGCRRRSAAVPSCAHTLLLSIYHRHDVPQQHAPPACRKGGREGGRHGLGLGVPLPRREDRRRGCGARVRGRVRRDRARRGDGGGRCRGALGWARWPLGAGGWGGVGAVGGSVRESGGEGMAWVS